MADLEGQDIFAQDFLQEQAEYEESSPIKLFYEGATVFVTGATGFVGKVLIEKLLSSTALKKIYILIREKNGKSCGRRLIETFESVNFESLKMQKPEALRKVVMIPGDISLPGMGLSDEDKEILCREVDILFHLAASSTTDVSLREAILTNVVGTKSVCMLAREMRRLKVMIAQSSAFCGWNSEIVEEKFVSPPMSAEKVIKLNEILEDIGLEIIESVLLENWPDAYTYTKAIAEELLKEYAFGLPLGVIRPGMVTSKAQLPIVGFADDLKGPQSAAYGCYTGLLKVLQLDKSVKAEIIPVDYVTNAALALAWDVGVTRGAGPSKDQLSYNEALLPEDQVTDNDISILNLVTGGVNPITWEKFFQYSLRPTKSRFSPKKLITVCLASKERTVLAFTAACWLFHLLPAFLYDAILFLTGHRTYFIKRYEKVHKLLDTFSPYCFRERQFEENSTWLLWDKLTRKDKTLFNFNVKHLDWPEYLDRYMRGICKYLKKGPAGSTPNY